MNQYGYILFLFYCLYFTSGTGENGTESEGTFLKVSIHEC